jgi:hypothetical protein
VASIDVPAGRPGVVPAAAAVLAKPRYITWLTLAFMPTSSVASLRSAPCQFAMTIFYYPTLLGFVASNCPEKAEPFQDRLDEFKTHNTIEP